MCNSVVGDKTMNFVRCVISLRKDFVKISVILFVLSMVIALSWSGHEGFTYHLVRDIVPDDMVQITPYNYREIRVYNLSKLVLEDVCGGDTIKTWKGVITPPNLEPVDDRVPAWQILTVYSSEPDWGMDQGVDFPLLLE